ncbi:MAG: hypothetical protein JWP87_3675 [Labilithrix sp.]|nr:hypothetical protein [Labilithrix sp.]
MPTNSSKRSSSKIAPLALAAFAAGTVFLGAPSVAHADDVKPDGKGIVGGALLGGEIVVFVEAIAGVRSGTAYVLGAGGGAIAGGLGGWAVEQAVSDGRVPAYMLAGGLALIIPALVVALDQTRYLPAEGAREDRPVNNLPPADPGKPGGGAVIGAEPRPGTPAAGSTPTGNPPSGTTPVPAPAPSPPPAGGTGGSPSPARGPANGPMSLINADLVRSGFSMGVPVPEVRPVFSANQKKALGVESAGNEVRFPVMNLTF